jgi:hypothetical protein
LRRPLAAEAFALAGRVCEAVRAGRAETLSALARTRHPELPFLGAALARLLEERPWAAGALGRSELQILRAVDAGAGTREAVFAATQAMEAAPFMGDSWLWRRLAELASGDEPLLATGARGLELTPAGRVAVTDYAGSSSPASP